MVPLELDSYAHSLFVMEPIRKPLTQAIISSLHLPEGSSGLDVGCGIGFQSILLAQAMGPNGRVTGMDVSESFLEIASELAQQGGVANQVSFHLGDWNHIPFENGTFDWVWSIDAAGYAPNEPVQTVQELARVIKPGGRLVLGFWSSQCLLPGYPQLEARLNASLGGIAPFTLEAKPEDHFMSTLGWMHKIGLTGTCVQTFVTTVFAPLAPGVRNALADLFSMRWGTDEKDVPSEDRRTYLRLCLPASPDFLPDRPSYCAFLTYSVFSGTVPSV